MVADYQFEDDPRWRPLEVPQVRIGRTLKAGPMRNLQKAISRSFARRAASV